MSIKFVDKYNKVHVFETYEEFTSWREAAIKTQQRFQGIDLNGRAEVLSYHVIEGFLYFENNVIVDSVKLYLNDIKEPIADIDFVYDESGARFKYEIRDQARVGNYTIRWNLSVNGTYQEVLKSFMITGDSIDRTLPLELQHLA